MTPKPRFVVLTALLLQTLVLHPQAGSQTGALFGEVVDPSGAFIAQARIRLVQHNVAVETRSNASGHYSIKALAAGSYAMKVSAKGFAPLTIRGISLSAGQVKELNLPLEIATNVEEVRVEDRIQDVGVGSEQNSSAMVFKGKDLDALSDDPNTLESELEQLGSAAAGPNGGQIYIDGFAGGQLPPKSSILEIRVNQNPFSSEYERVGYGRVEVITKPGSDKLRGSLSGYGNTSAVNTGNPMLKAQPEYDLYSYAGNIGGPLGKHASFFVSGFELKEQNQSIVNAVDPENTAANITQAISTPLSKTILSPRLDMQIGKHTLSFRNFFYRNVVTGSGVGALSLASQAVNINDKENTFQASDVIQIKERFLSEARFRWRRVRNTQTATHATPTVTVSGAFTDGGNRAGVVQDHQDIFEAQNYWTATAGNHTQRFGARLRTTRDANYSTAGSNGTYTFNSIADYLAAKPAQYSATIVNNPRAHAVLVEGSAFFQDDWRVRPNLMIGLGVRFEDQNWISDPTNLAPRVALAWSPGQRRGTAPAKTVIRAGYGWFYNRFTTPNSLSSSAGAPYVIQTLHDNGVNQKSYVVNHPNFYDPTAPAPPSTLAASSSSVPSFHSIDPKFKAAVDMQAGAGIDHSFTRAFTANATYLYTQGVHQYFSNNVTAPAFNAATYTVAGAAPATYNYQFQSGGVYKQHQLTFTGTVQTGRFVLNGNYTFNEAKSDTQGVTSFVSVAQNPGLDYGRASFGVRHRVTAMESTTLPYGIVVASLLEAQSGTPYNLTIGRDLTGNSLFNARPGYGSCGAADVIATRYGCLDPNPAGKGERIVPFGAGIGPANVLFDLRASKVIGVGPRIKTSSAGRTMESKSGNGLGGGGATIRLDEGAARRYSLTLAVGASNLLNIVNWGTPNGVLLSPIFGRSQSLAGGAFANPTSGNRAIVFQSSFSF